MPSDQTPIEIPKAATKAEADALAQLRVEPFLRHGFLTNWLASHTVKSERIAPSPYDAGEAIRAMADTVSAGDLRPITNALMAQGLMLDAASTEMMGRAWRNAGEYPEAMQRYMSLALKAQAQSRATLETLAKLHQPREQIVRHVHVYEGGQAVVAEQLHMNGSGGQNGEYADQPHTLGAPISALPSDNPKGHDVPVASSQRKEAVPHARRRGRERRPAGK